MKESEIPECRCPHCGHLFDHASGYGGNDKPKPGNWTLCVSCVAVLRFGDDLRPRPIDEMEKLQVESSGLWPQLRRVIEILKHGNARAHRARKGVTGS